MFSEIDSINGIGGCGFEWFSRPVEGNVNHTTFHEAIFSSLMSYAWSLTKSVSLQTAQPELAQKVQSAARGCATIAPLSGYEFYGSVKGEWGGEDGTRFTGSASARVYDDKGNEAKVEVEQDSDGKGSVTVDAKQEKNWDDE